MKAAVTIDSEGRKTVAEPCLEPCPIERGMRLLGGLVYFVGMLVMAYNVYKTVAKEKPVPVAVMDPA